MLLYTEPKTFAVGRGTVTLRFSTYRAIDICHEVVHADNERVIHKYYPMREKVRTGRHGCSHFDSEAELIEAIDRHLAQLEHLNGTAEMKLMVSLR